MQGLLASFRAGLTRRRGVRPSRTLYVSNLLRTGVAGPLAMIALTGGLLRRGSGLNARSATVCSHPEVFRNCW